MIFCFITISLWYHFGWFFCSNHIPECHSNCGFCWFKVCHETTHQLNSVPFLFCFFRVSLPNEANSQKEILFYYHNTKTYIDVMSRTNEQQTLEQLHPCGEISSPVFLTLCFQSRFPLPQFSSFSLSQTHNRWCVLLSKSQSLGGGPVRRSFPLRPREASHKCLLEARVFLHVPSFNWLKWL